MKLEKNFYYIAAILSTFLIGAMVFTFIVYKSFFWSAFISLIFYLGTREYYLKLKFFLPKKIADIAPYLMIILVLIMIGIPLVFITSQLISEILSFLFVLRVNLTEERLIPFLLNFPILTDYITDTEFFWVQLPITYKEVAESYGDVLNIDSLYGIFSNASSLILGGIRLPLEFFTNSFFVFILLFFLYKEGSKIERFFVSTLPISIEIKQKILYRILDAVKAVLKGNLVISILQGFNLAIILFFAGISSPIFYGSMGAFFSLIPVVGTAIIWLPAGLYLILYEGNFLSGFLVMLFSFSSYMILENFIKPSMLDRKLNIHPFLLFLSLLGGIQEFGIMGVIIGPVMVTIIVILWDFWVYYRNENSKNLPDSKGEII